MTVFAVPKLSLASPSPSAEENASTTGTADDLDSVGDRSSTAGETAADDSAPNEQPAQERPDASDSAEGPEPGPVADVENDADTKSSDAESEVSNAAPIRPPRVDGAYLGGVVSTAATFARVNDWETSGAFIGPGGSVRVGEAVFPWMTIGIQAGGRAGFKGAQRVYQGGVVVELGFLPVPKYPLSILAGFGVGGGAVHEQDVEGRAGFGGALFKGGVRYDLFPGAAKRRPKRGGGFSLGPELSWVGFTPAAKGRPMSNSIVLGLWLGYYFGS